MKILLVILSLYSGSLLAEDKNQAISHIQKAIVKTDTAIKYRKNLNKAIKESVPEDIKPYLPTLGVIGSAVVSGKIDTQKLKNIDMDIFGGEIRPNLEYDFRQDEVNANINYTMEF